MTGKVAHSINIHIIYNTYGFHTSLACTYVTMVFLPCWFSDFQKTSGNVIGAGFAAGGCKNEYCIEERVTHFSVCVRDAHVYIIK